MPDVAELFRIVAERMRGDLRLARAALTHPGLRGASFEEAFRSFLRTYLPRTLEVSTGVIVDSVGGYSRQIDVIISDAARTPVLYAVGETRVVPVECVYMAIKVKAHLNAGVQIRRLSRRYAIWRRAYGRGSAGGGANLSEVS
jgi:hypothetical protein